MEWQELLSLPPAVMDETPIETLRNTESKKDYARPPTLRAFGDGMYAIYLRVCELDEIGDTIGIDTQPFVAAWRKLVEGGEPLHKRYTEYISTIGRWMLTQQTATGVPTATVTELHQWWHWGAYHAVLRTLSLGWSATETRAAILKAQRDARTPPRVHSVPSKIDESRANTTKGNTGGPCRRPLTT